jgi:hypothetical protein
MMLGEPITCITQSFCLPGINNAALKTVCNSMSFKDGCEVEYGIVDGCHMAKVRP